MHFKFIDAEVECVAFQYRDTENVFEIKDTEKNVICEYYPELELDSEYDPKEFECYLLRNDRSDYSENSIFQVYASKERIGWIFPIQALMSKQHDYVENKFFLRYAYVACCWLLENIECINQRFTETIELSDFYADTITILVLDKENIKRICDFQLEDYTVSLYQKGYSYSGKGNLYSTIENANKRINLQPISKELRNIKYIHTLFEKEVPKNQEAFAKFHTYYQIIEILISVVFEDKFKKFVTQLSDDMDSLFDKRDELGNIVLEKQRVKWLFSNYVKLSGEDVAILDGYCKNLLKINGKKISNTMAENLYSVRCLLVHNMYILNDKSHELLGELDNAFIDVLMDMLLTFDTKR
jgi:hypothetical protein